MNTLLLDALRCQNTARPPVWLMRQAGRYMPEYRALRKKYSFLDLVHTPELATEVTLLPIDQLDVDAAILFSDILVVLEAMGLSIHFDENIGPIIDNPLTNAKNLEQLMTSNISESLAYVGKAIHLLKNTLKVPLLGFCGAPFTLASYMIEGKSSRDLRKTKQWMFNDPISFHQLLTKISQCTIEYLKLQIEAGADAIQIFDSWANYLGYAQFQEFSLKYLEQILIALKPFQVPMIIFCRGSSVFAPDLAKISPQAISLDWNCNISEIRRHIPTYIALQGNLDPDILHAPKAVIKQEAQRILQQMSADPGYIFNLGHGILPTVPFDHVKWLIECVKT